MLTVNEAEQRIAERMPAFGSEVVGQSEASGRVLLEPIHAERDQPPFDRVTMDGIAISHAAWSNGIRTFTIQGTQAAGDAVMTLAGADHCIEIMTGAALPDGTDSIVPVEYLTLEKGRATIAPDYRAVAGESVHPRGSDFPKGSEILAPGVLLRAPEMSVLASSGRSEVLVGRQPSIQVISTGNELVGPGQPIESYQIRHSNGPAIVSALTERGFDRTDEVLLPDDPNILRKELGRFLEETDVLIMSGGVSMGKFDYIPGVLDHLGVEVVFHKISQRPGKPMWFGVAQNDCAIFALPGNPVSTLVCLIRYVIPALYHAMGLNRQEPERVRLDGEVTFSPRLTWFLPVIVHADWHGIALAKPRPTNTSGDFRALVGTTGFVELDREQSRFPKGTVARLYRW